MIEWACIRRLLGNIIRSYRAGLQTINTALDDIADTLGF